jgi:hypothetical protein
MGSAVGMTLPLAVGVAISPLPIIALILLLVGPRARTSGAAFVVGWLAGLGVVGTVGLVVADSAGAVASAKPAGWVNAAQLCIGLALLGLAVRGWLRRPADDDDHDPPRWMATIDSFSVSRALMFGILFSGVKPKNLLLTLGAASLIAETGIAWGQQAIALGIFVLIGSLGVLAPVAIYVSLGANAARVLDDITTWMIRYNAVIMAVLFLVFGAVLVGDAITGFGA